MKFLPPVVLVIFLATIIGFAFVAGCSSASSVGGQKIGDSYIYYVHDDVHKVGIWSGSGGAISVIPDSEYQK